MRQVVEQPATCLGCEFNGDIPGGSACSLRVTRTRGEDGTVIVYRLDDELRVSNGIVDSKRLEQGVDPKETSRLMMQCSGAAACALEQAGLIPVEPSLDEKKVVIESAVASFEGVQALGNVTIDIQ